MADNIQHAHACEGRSQVSALSWALPTAMSTTRLHFTGPTLLPIQPNQSCCVLHDYYAMATRHGTMACVTCLSARLHAQLGSAHNATPYNRYYDQGRAMQHMLAICSRAPQCKHLLLSILRRQASPTVRTLCLRGRNGGLACAAGNVHKRSIACVHN